ncbi:MAG: hypothetical protein LUD02_01825 [Tannerellaceae bacterium]|nr:hypothetical protein [Tannerellaceae bacterium]MCD8263032.1 hypothetical protein [Tannerellaceae bacterium]
MVIQRILIRHGFSHDMAQLFMEDLVRSIDYLKENPVRKGYSETEAGGYHH